MSVETASLAMLLWDKGFLAKLRRMGLKVGLYKRYVDDIIVIIDEIAPGWFFCGDSGRMTFDPEHPTAKMEPDARTFSVLEAIANTLNGDIQMESDVSSNHASGRLPVLDLDMFMTGEGVEFSFYQKPMNSPFCNMYRSALAAKTKRDSLFQEGLRRLRNMSQGISHLERCSIMDRFMNTVRVSGYDARYRVTLLKGILDRQKQLETEFESGEKQRYRSRQQIKDQKSAKLGKYPDTWFIKGDVGNTLKVPFTPGGKLKDMIGRKLSARGLTTADGCLTKVVELAGKSITSGLAKMENFGGDTGCHMGPQKCLIASDADCRINRAIYNIICQNCEGNPSAKVARYVGTTGRTIHARSLEHIQAIESRSTKNPMSKHQQNAHPDHPASFRTEILAGGIRFNLDRFISEALHIENARRDVSTDILNQRSEWGQAGLPRMRSYQ